MIKNFPNKMALTSKLQVYKDFKFEAYCLLNIFAMPVNQCIQNLKHLRLYGRHKLDLILQKKKWTQSLVGSERS